jgi:hypothetical protein
MFRTGRMLEELEPDYDAISNAFHAYDEETEVQCPFICSAYDD